MLIKLLFYYVSEMRRVCGLVRVMTNKTRSKKLDSNCQANVIQLVSADLYKSKEGYYFFVCRIYFEKFVLEITWHTFCLIA